MKQRHGTPAKRHKHRAGRALAVCAALAAALPAAPMRAQEVRRAMPADGDEIPAARAVPFFDGERPRATPTQQRPRAIPPPAVSDETGPRTAPTPPERGVSSSTADQIQLDFANGFYARGLYDMAAPEYEKYVGLYPGAPGRQAAYFYLGESYRKLGSMNSAKTSYQALLSAFSVGEFVGPAAYRLADIHFAEKNYSAALPLYRKASVRVKDPAVALAAKFYTARCLELMKMPTDARVVYEDIAATKGDNIYRSASRLALAQILAGLGRKEEAMRQYDALANETDKPEVKAEVLVKSGLLKIENGQADKGAADLNKALKLPEIGAFKPVAQIGLLRALYETNKYKQLLDAYADALKDLPAESKPEVLILAANSQRQLGHQKEAGDLYDQVLKEYPDTVYAKQARYERLVNLYNSDSPELTKAVDEYLAANPEPEKRDQITLMKAEGLFKQQKYAEAAPVYASLGDSKLPSSFKTEALFRLGWCYAQTRDPENAAKTFTEFLEANPVSKLVPTALAQRAVAQQQLKNFPAALKDFNALLDRYPRALKERELALTQKALILGQQQDNAGMSDTFKTLLREFPKSTAAAQANYWIGWTAFEAKDYKAAIAPLEAARRLDKAQFFERATLRLILAHYYLEERDALAAEVDSFAKGAPKAKVPAETLRWLGGAFLSVGEWENAEKYLAALAKRDGETTPDDALNLGRAQLGAKKYAEAVKSLRLYLEGRTEPVPRATGLLELGRAQLGLAKLDDAQKSSDEACSLQPDGRLYAEGRMLAGDIAAARGSNDEAAKIFQSVAVIVDDPQITPQALERAYESLVRAGSDPEAAKVLNTLQTKFPEYQLKRAAP